MMRPDDSATCCALHLGCPAVHACTRCGRLLCERCTIRRGEGRQEIRVCPCGGLVVPLPPSRRTTPLRDLPLYPASRDGLFVLVGLAVLIELLSLGGALHPLLRPFGVLVEVGLVCGYLFKVVRHGADGRVGVPAPTDLIAFLDLIWPAFQVTLLLVVLAAPAVIYGVLAWPRAWVHPQPVLEDPGFWLLLVPALFLLPLAVIALVLERRLLTAVNPLLLVRSLLAAPLDYAYAGGLCWIGVAASIGVAWGVGWLLSPLLAVPVLGWVVGVVGTALSLYLPLVAARALGEYVATVGERLGYAPAAVIPVARQHDDASPESVADLILAGERSRAIAAYHELVRDESDFAGLEPRELLTLAGWLEEAEDYRAAATNLRRLAIKFPGHARAGESLLRAARLHHHKLAEPDYAEQLLGYLLEHFPADLHVDEARRLLAALGERGRPERLE